MSNFIPKMVMVLHSHLVRTFHWIRGFSLCLLWMAQEPKCPYTLVTRTAFWNSFTCKFTHFVILMLAGLEGCVCVFVFVCVCVSVQTHMHECMLVHTHTTCKHTHARAHTTQLHTTTKTYTHINTFTCACTHVYTWTCIYCSHAYILTCLHLNMCTCAHVHPSSQSLTLECDKSIFYKIIVHKVYLGA